MLITRPGVLNTININRNNYKCFIYNLQRKYICKTNDRVIGTIIKKNSQFYTIDINSSKYGILETLAFEGATKRNKPALNIGDSVYCKVQQYKKTQRMVFGFIIKL